MAKIKIRKLTAAIVTSWLAAACLLQGADATTRLSAKSGSKIRIEGTSNIHDWQVEGTLIGGSMEVGPSFPVEPGQAATPGKVQATATASVTVALLKSVKEDGRPYDDTMDEVMCEHLRAKDHPTIFFYLKELVLKEPAKSKSEPYLFDAKGNLVVAGVTNTIAMPVRILPLGGGKLKISGAVSVKMTDFKVEPPSPKILLNLIKTGDEVKLIFDWMVGQRKPAATPAGK